MIDHFIFNSYILLLAGKLKEEKGDLREVKINLKYQQLSLKDKHNKTYPLLVREEKDGQRVARTK